MNRLSRSTTRLDRCGRSLGAIVIAVAVIGAIVEPAAAHGPDPVLGGVAFGQGQDLKFKWRSGAVPVTAIAAAIKAAALDVTESKNSKAATFTYSTSGPNLIGYGVGATCGVNGLACFTRSAPNSFTMWLREQGHVFEWGTLKWCQAYASAPNGCYDAETIALDEFGHVEMLDHHVNEPDSSDYKDAVVQTYSRTKPQAGWNMHAFGRCDIATLQREYDMTSWTAKYSTCNDLSTTLAVTAPTAVVYGGTVSIVATLKVAALASYERLGANPISGRTVTLQTRGVGATAWLSAGTMAVGSASGTYTKSLRLTADLQVRAVFSTPTDEGLTGKTSAVVTIDAGPCTVAPCPQLVE